MEKISEDTWKEILNNQKFPLIGTNEPNNGNGYHDGISWRIPFRPQKVFDEEFYHSTFYSIYLRDLGLLLNPSLSRKDKFEGGLKISNCSKNYSNTLLKYLSNDDYYYRTGNLLHTLGEWGKYFSHNGRLVFEIIGWYDNQSSQFYGFKLNQLDIDYCKINKNYVIYNAPYELAGDKEIFKQVKIPTSKCVIINFPSELGGYNGFMQKVKQVKNLGNQFNYSVNPKNSLTYMKNWDKQFNKIVSDWGASNKIENVTDFYQELNAFKFRYMAISCTHEIVHGLHQLIDYLNIKLKENVTLELNIQQYDKSYFKNMQDKWMNGELSFKEANNFLRL
jgi:hypothetical protein